MNRVAPLIFTLLILSCGDKSDSSEGTDFSDTLLDPKDQFARQIRTDTIILYEDRIKRITLPFEKKEVLADLEKEFAGLTVSKEIGQQDGPNFPLYSIRDRNGEICFFAMDWADSLKLNEIVVKQPIIKDQYGLKVGDTYQKIKQLRNDDVKTYTDYHQHTYAYFEASNIIYEISGDVFLPDTVDFENLKFTEEQIKDWAIEYLIWRK